MLGCFSTVLLVALICPASSQRLHSEALSLPVPRQLVPRTPSGSEAPSRLGGTLGPLDDG